MTAKDPDTLPDSVDANGPCPRCGRIANFAVVGSVPLAYRPGIRTQHGERLPNQRVSILTCAACSDGIVVIEQLWVGGVRNGSSGLEQWRGMFWWPTPGAAEFGPEVPPAVAKAYDEGLRCVSISAPNAAAAMLRNAIAAIVEDKGSVEAKSKRDLAPRIKQMIKDGSFGEAVGEWVDHVRLYGNAGAHPEAFGDVTVEESKEIASLVYTLIELIYLTPAKLAKRIANRAANGA